MPQSLRRSLNPVDPRLRLFVAAALPSAARDGVARLSREARSRWPAGSVRWTAPDQLHLTLRFLGDTPATAVAPLLAALKGALSGVDAVHLRLGPLGFFPNRARPQVLWVAVEDDSESLVGLQLRVEAAVNALGFAVETRPYRPHLTLGRIKRGVRPPDDWACTPRSLEFAVRAVELVQSRLGPDGARYRVLGHQALLP